MAQVQEERVPDMLGEPNLDRKRPSAAFHHRLVYDEFGIHDPAALWECICEVCTMRRNYTLQSVDQQQSIQFCWLELQQYIRIVYRMSMKGTLKSIDSSYQNYMKDIVTRLFDMCDAHHFYMKLEALVKNFIGEIKVQLLQMLDQMADKPKLPHLFLTGILDRYGKVMNAANVIAPVLTQLEEQHLNQFCMTWVLLNQRLFQSIIYGDVFLQNSVPLFLSQLEKQNETQESEENTKLIQEFLKFDQELGLVEGLWVDVESSIAHYLQNQSFEQEASPDIRNWEEFTNPKQEENRRPSMERRPSEERRPTEEKWFGLGEEALMFLANWAAYCETHRDEIIAKRKKSGGDVEDIDLESKFPGIKEWEEERKAWMDSTLPDDRISRTAEERGTPDVEKDDNPIPDENINRPDEERGPPDVNVDEEPVNDEISERPKEEKDTPDIVGEENEEFHKEELSDSSKHESNVSVTPPDNSDIKDGRLTPEIEADDDTDTRDWEEFLDSGQNELNGDLTPPGNSDSPDLPTTNEDLENMDDIQAISMEGVETEVITETCECHVCLDASSHTPVELMEQVIPLYSHRSGFHLYPHIHGPRAHPGRYPPFLPECEIPEICGQVGTINEQQVWQGQFARGMNNVHIPKHHHHHHHHLSHAAKKRVDKATQKDQEVTNVKEEKVEKVKTENCKPNHGVHQVHHTHNHAHPHTHKAKENGSEVNNSHHFHCSKHPEIKKESPSEHEDHHHPAEDPHSENSPGDPRHCDCCYCEVFGHGLPSSAPMSRNYQEMRERLRLLLNKKKSKCKNNNAKSPQIVPPKKNKAPEVSQPTNAEMDTRALDDLLDFIEGNEAKCKNEKKAAKKARQKEKKRILLLRKKKEEEERARALEQAIQQKKREEALAAKEAEERARANNKNKKKNSKGSNKNNTSSSEKASPQKKPGPQMVTIKRVMEPHNSEPTVTITLRGATPNQDRVLYTLLNGQVCKANDKKNTNDQKNKSSGKTNVSTPPPPPAYKVKEAPPKEQPKTKKEKKNKENSTQISNMKPVKELTNPTSIQINNAVKTMTKKTSPTFNIADIKLPPGITITKVDPSTVQTRNSKLQETNANKVNTSQARPPSEVIVVTTGKRPNKEQPAVLNKQPTPDKETIPGASGKRKRSKKKNASNNAVMPPDGKASYPGLEIQPIKVIDTEKEKDRVNNKSVLTISPYADNKVEKNDASKIKKKLVPKIVPLRSVSSEEMRLLDSVFAPKDIEHDEELDETERELEAFKRFCLQSVPPERKEKVHLNIKDIILKKKSSMPFSYNLVNTMSN